MKLLFLITVYATDVTNENTTTYINEVLALPLPHRQREF